jgi:hypothetical protein
MSDPRTAFGQARAAQPHRDIGFGEQGGSSDGEPPLNEVLVDAIVHRLMERDGVQMPDLISLIGETRRRLR